MDALQEIDTALLQGQGMQYTMGAAIIMLLYDVLITTGDEIRLIWGAPRSMTKYLYFVNRYAVPVALLFHLYIMSSASFGTVFTSEFCYRYVFWIQVFDSVEGCGVIGILILLRVYALYKDVRGIKIMLVALWLAYTIPPLIINIYSGATYFAAPGVISYNTILGICALSGRPRYMWVMWLFMVMFETIVCGLIVFKTYQHARTSFGSRLSAILFRDGLFYYAILLVGETVNMAAFLALGEYLYLFAVYPDWCFASLLVSRIYLNLRDVNNHHDWTAATTVHDTPQWSAQVEAARLRQERRKRRGSPEVDDTDMELSVVDVQEN